MYHLADSLVDVEANILDDVDVSDDELERAADRERGPGITLQFCTPNWPCKY